MPCRAPSQRTLRSFTAPARSPIFSSSAKAVAWGLACGVPIRWGLTESGRALTQWRDVRHRALRRPTQILRPLRRHPIYTVLLMVQKSRLRVLQRGRVLQSRVRWLSARLSRHRRPMVRRGQPRRTATVMMDVLTWIRLPTAPADGPWRVKDVLRRALRTRQVLRRWMCHDRDQRLRRPPPAQRPRLSSPRSLLRPALLQTTP